MKKLLFVLLGTFFIAIGTQSASAQVSIPQETKMLNPQLFNIGFNSMKLGIVDHDSDYKVSRFGVALSGGYAVVDNLLVKGELALQYGKYEDNSAYLLSIGAGAKYYLPMGVFAGAGLNYSYGKANLKGVSSSALSDGSIDVGFVDLRILAGYAFFVTDNISLEPAVSYGFKIAGGEIGDTGVKLKYSRLSIDVGMSLFF